MCGMADNIGIACGRTSYAAAMLGIAVTALIYTLTRIGAAIYVVDCHTRA